MAAVPCAPIDYIFRIQAILRFAAAAGGYRVNIDAIENADEVLGAGKRCRHNSARGEDALGEGTRDIVSRLYDAYARRDFDHVAATLHDDIDWIIYSPVSVFPFAGQRRGRASVLQAMADIGAQYQLDNYQHEIMIVDGDRAAVMSDARFTQRATGRVLRFRIANFLRFQDGKLIEFREFVNSFDVVEQALGRELAL